MVTITLYAKQKKRHRCTEQTFGLCGRRRGWDVLREQHRNIYYLGWNRPPTQVGCMRQVLRAGALGRPRGIGWRGRWEGGSGWGTHVNPWLIPVSVWQKSLQYCKLISIQLIKINGKKKNVHCWMNVLISPFYHTFCWTSFSLLSSNQFAPNLKTSLWFITVSWLLCDIITSNWHKKIPRSTWRNCFYVHIYIIF